jgi:putative addiction module component (TIGR02574 family)
MTSKGLRKELFELSRAEKLELVEELWDNIASDADGEAAPLTAAQREDLERRLREMDEHPERGRPWEEVRERLWKRMRG